jgi:hypothetical protein
LIAFYFEGAKRLTSEERLWAIRTAGPRLSGALTAKTLEENWTFRDEFLTIDLAPFLRKTWERWRQLKEARAMVIISPEIMAAKRRLWRLFLLGPRNLGMTPAGAIAEKG